MTQSAHVANKASILCGAHSALTTQLQCSKLAVSAYLPTESQPARRVSTAAGAVTFWEGAVPFCAELGASAFGLEDEFVLCSAQCQEMLPLTTTTDTLQSPVAETLATAVCPSAEHRSPVTAVVRPPGACSHVPDDMLFAQQCMHPLLLAECSPVATAVEFANPSFVAWLTAVALPPELAAVAVATDALWPFLNPHVDDLAATTAIASAEAIKRLLSCSGTPCSARSLSNVARMYHLPTFIDQPWSVLMSPGLHAQC
jgi:hypothetical protein